MSRFAFPSATAMTVTATISSSLFPSLCGRFGADTPAALEVVVGIHHDGHAKASRAAILEEQHVKIDGRGGLVHGDEKDFSSFQFNTFVAGTLACRLRGRWPAPCHRRRHPPLCLVDELRPLFGTVPRPCTPEAVRRGALAPFVIRESLLAPTSTSSYKQLAPRDLLGPLRAS